MRIRKTWRRCTSYLGGGCETHHVKNCLQYIASFISNQHCTRQFVLKRNETNWNDAGKIGLHPYREKICLHFVPFRSISGQSELIIVPINLQSTNQSSHCCVAHVRQIAPTLCHQTEWVVYECFMVVWTWNYYASRTWDMCHDCWLQFAALNWISFACNHFHKKSSRSCKAIGGHRLHCVESTILNNPPPSAWRSLTLLTQKPVVFNCRHS